MPTKLELIEKINKKVNQISDQISQISDGDGSNIKDQKTQRYIQNEFQILKDVLKIVDDQEALNLVYQMFERIYGVTLNINKIPPHKVNERLQELQRKFNQEIFNLIQKSLTGDPKNAFAQFG